MSINTILIGVVVVVAILLYRKEIFGLTRKVLNLRPQRNESDEGGEHESEKSPKKFFDRVDVEKLAKRIFVVANVIALIVLINGIRLNDWALMLVTSIFFIAVLATSIFRVKKVRVAVPDSFFLGRFKKETDDLNCRIPVGPAKLEGLRLKWPWHRYDEYQRDLQLYVINNQKYQTKEGSVFVKGIIRYRTTALLPYRAAEMTREERMQALGDKTDNVIIPLLIEKDLKEAMKARGHIVNALMDELNSKAKVADPKDPTKTVERNPLFGRIPTYAENAFASEIIEVNISSIDLPPDIQKARDDISVERLKNEELQLYLEKDEFIKATFPALTDPEKRIQLLQVWANQAKRDIKTFEISDLKLFGEIAEKILKK